MFSNNLKKFCLFFSILILFNSMFLDTIFSAMDPVEIKKLNGEAPYHIIGKVTDDDLFQDLSVEKSVPYQLRKMTIAIEEVLKSSSSSTSTSHSIDVYYTYIPSWQAREYVGGSKLMDITISDVIEVYLEEGEHGWEPVLSGDSVRHIKYVEKRHEPISEPPLHILKRTVEANIQNNQNGIVLTGILFSIIVLIYFGLRKK